ncbi:MAG: hypothetical protein ABFD83_02050 [Armatimonadota bacterium]
MNIEEKRKRLYEELLLLLRSTGTTVSRRISGDSIIPPGNVAKYYEYMQQKLTSKEDLLALQRVVVSECMGLFHSFFCILDGVNLNFDAFPIALIDSDTNEDLNPERETTYHDSFLDYLYENMSPDEL